MNLFESCIILVKPISKYSSPIGISFNKEKINCSGRKDEKMDEKNFEKIFHSFNKIILNDYHCSNLVIKINL